MCVADYCTLLRQCAFTWQSRRVFFIRLFHLILLSFMPATTCARCATRGVWMEDGRDDGVTRLILLCQHRRDGEVGLSHRFRFARTASSSAAKIETLKTPPRRREPALHLCTSATRLPSLAVSSALSLSIGSCSALGAVASILRPQCSNSTLWALRRLGCQADSSQSKPPHGGH